jgi:hypothetical protein
VNHRQTHTYLIWKTIDLIKFAIHIAKAVKSSCGLLIALHVWSIITMTGSGADSGAGTTVRNSGKYRTAKIVKRKMVEVRIFEL